MSRQREYGEDLRGGEDRDREEEEEEERSQTLSEEEEELKGTGSAQQRKRDALFPAISSICQALGGYEEFKNVNGEIITEYSLGDQVVGTYFNYITKGKKKTRTRKKKLIVYFFF